MFQPTGKAALLHLEVYRVVDTVIEQIEHLPHGYSWWYGLLPSRGRNNRDAIRKHWADVLLAKLFPVSFLQALVAASILPGGKPNDPLYIWVSAHIYAGDTEAHYADWFRLKEGK